jgi:hypothetical protein
MPRCAGIKRDGGRCAVVVGAGHTHCYSHDPARENERKRNASRGGRSKGGGELVALKKQAKDLAADVLEGNVETSKAAVANQIFNTLIRAIEQERKNLETGELAERLEAMEEVLKGRRTG